MKRLTLLWRALRRWEFWPYWLFYTPVYLQLIIRGVAARSMVRFLCANPGIPYGGLLEYSKWEVLKQLPDKHVPKTVVIPMRSSLQDARARCTQAKLTFPFYAKPDRGERGLFVSRIENEIDLKLYLDSCRAFLLEAAAAGLDVGNEMLLLQDEAPGSYEYGVLFARMPGEPGRVTSIVEKQLLFVTGDGQSSLAELIDAGERTRLHRVMLREQFRDRLSEVPETGAMVRLVDVGNHVRGATFLNANDLISDELNAVFEGIVSSMDRFFVGRFDLRCEHPHELTQGRFTVVEVNGVNSEPAHIYDPGNRLVIAYRDLLSHWRMVHRIARANAPGCSPPAFRELAAALGRHGKRRRAAARALVGPKSI